VATVEAELKRRDAALALVDWLLAADAENPATGLSDPVVEYGLRDRLQTLIDSGIEVNNLSGLATEATLSAVETALGPLATEATLTAVGVALAGLATETTLADILAELQGGIAVGGAVAITNLPAEYPLPAGQVATLTPQTDTLTDGQLRADPVDVEDDYDLSEYEVDQIGADAVLTFTFTGPQQLVWVDVDPVSPSDTTNYRARTTVDGSAPTATRGWVCRAGQGTPIPVPMTGNDVLVWAPTGTVAAVQGASRL